MPRLPYLLQNKDHIRKDRGSKCADCILHMSRSRLCTSFYIYPCPDFIHPCAMILHTPVPWSPLSNRFPPQAPTFGRVTGVTDLVGIWHHVQVCGLLHTSWPPSAPPSTAPMVPCSCSKWSKHPLPNHHLFTRPLLYHPVPIPFSPNPLFLGLEKSDHIGYHLTLNGWVAPGRRENIWGIFRFSLLLPE